MYIHVNGHKTYAYTGGKDFNPAQRTVVLIHGVLCDHSVWALQSRYLANHGWNVLAIDLPGHCRSAGEPPATVEAAADFVLALLDSAGLAQAVGKIVARQHHVRHAAHHPVEQFHRQADGALDTNTRGLIRAREMLGDYEEPKLDPGIDEALCDYIARREREIPAADALNQEY